MRNWMLVMRWIWRSPRWAALILSASGLFWSMPAWAQPMSCVIDPATLKPVECTTPGDKGPILINGGNTPVSSPTFAYTSNGYLSATSSASTALPDPNGDPSVPRATDHAVANSRIGSIGVTATASAVDQQGGAEVWASAGWDDHVTINAPGLTGQNGIWKGTIVLEGSVRADTTDKDPYASSGIHTGFAMSEVALHMPGVLTSSVLSPCNPGMELTQAQGCVLATQTPGPGGYSDGTQGVWALPFAIQFKYGTSINLNVALYAYAAVLSCSSNTVQNLNCESDAASSFGHTLRWGGTSSILNASGQALDNYTMNSESGFNYLAAATVPEPAGWGLLLLGLGIVAGHVRRARPVPSIHQR